MKLDEIEDAFLFVSSASQCTNSAFLSKETGEIFYISGMGDSDDLPEDMEDSDEYIEIPHKNDLDLGNRLVMDFVAEQCPELLEKVPAIFKRKGAYSRYKELLDSKGLLEKWYDYENQRTKEALRQWCADNGIELTDT
jgi:hypothetical protein